MRGSRWEEENQRWRGGGRTSEHLERTAVYGKSARDLGGAERLVDADDLLDELGVGRGGEGEGEGPGGEGVSGRAATEQGKSKPYTVCQLLRSSDSDIVVEVVKDKCRGRFDSREPTLLDFLPLASTLKDGSKETISTCFGSQDIPGEPARCAPVLSSAEHLQCCSFNRLTRPTPSSQRPLLEACSYQEKHLYCSS